MPLHNSLVMDESVTHLIGIYLSDKKFNKLRWDDLVGVCKKHGYDLKKVDIENPLEDQGNIKIFIHKLTETLAAADMGDTKAEEIINNVEQYIVNNPQMLVIDPINNVRILLDRYKYYSLLEKHPILISSGVFTPNFCLLTTNNINDNMNTMRSRGVTFPLVCKTLLAHGSKSAHRMSVIFNEAGLAHCQPPCVLQSFVNHNAVLYKLFVVGNRYFMEERPSLKNFYPCKERETIHFNSGEVCKADSQSTLSILDPHEITDNDVKICLDEKIIEAVIRVLRKELKLTLFGVDIVIDNATNAYAIIDINFYPGYEGFPNFFDHLVEVIDESYILFESNKNLLNSIINKNFDSLNNCLINCTENDKKNLINVKYIKK